LKAPARLHISRLPDPAKSEIGCEPESQQGSPVTFDVRALLLTYLSVSFGPPGRYSSPPSNSISPRTSQLQLQAPQLTSPQTTYHDGSIQPDVQPPKPRSRQHPRNAICHDGPRSMRPPSTRPSIQDSHRGECLILVSRQHI
jgi:hypothetical protein